MKPKTTASGDDPADMGALLTEAFRASGLTLAELGRRAGMAPNNVRRAMGSPDARNPAVRAILRALGARLALRLVVIEDAGGMAPAGPVAPVPEARGPGRRYNPKTRQFEPA